MVAPPPLEALDTDGRHCGWRVRDHRMHFRQRDASYDTRRTRRASVLNRHEAEVYRLKGELLLMRDDSSGAEAEGCFQRAIEIARNQNAKS